MVKVDIKKKKKKKKKTKKTTNKQTDKQTKQTNKQFLGANWSLRADTIWAQLFKALLA